MTTDVVVIGGGQAGVCAAIAAAEGGARTVLITDRPVLGGNASSECGVPPHGADAMGHNRNCRDTGILEELRLEYYLRRSPDSDNRREWDRLLLERCRKTEGLTVLRDTRIVNCTRTGRSIDEVAGVSLRTGENVIVQGNQFIDATGDGFLGARAGASFLYGREGTVEFGETILGRPETDGKTLGSSIYGWAQRRDYPVPYSPPTDAVEYPDCDSLSHRPHTREHIFPTITSARDGSTIQFFWWIEWGGQLDVIRDSDEIYERLTSELFGIWDHLKNRCDVETRSALEQYELVRWSAFPLRRESRRIVGDHILSENDVLMRPSFRDVVGFGGWPLDDHPPDGLVSQNPPCNQVFLYEPFGVPLGCLYSRDLDNLFMAGRCMSVTHVALSSVRVMNTLGILGEAAGTAAAMCSVHGITPRQLRAGMIEDLQQELIRRDLYLPGVNPKSRMNLASGAETTATSSLELRCDRPIGFLPLCYDTALQFPVSSESLLRIEVQLKAEERRCTSSTMNMNRPVKVKWSLRFGDSIGSFDYSVNPVASGEIEVTGDGGWYRISPQVSVEPGSICTLILEENESVRWAYCEELFHTRWGIRYGTERRPRAYHGGAACAPTDDPWLFVNHNGRLPEEVEDWLDPLPGFKSHSKLYATPAFRTFPGQKPYGPENIVNGRGRSIGRPNIWISEPTLPGQAQAVTLKWPSRVRVSRIELIFDTNLDYADQMYGFPRGVGDFAIPNPIEETVKSYELVARSLGEVVEVFEESGNYHRRRMHEPDKACEIDEIEVRVLETWGARSARIFDVRIY